MRNFLPKPVFQAPKLPSAGDATVCTTYNGTQQTLDTVLEQLFAIEAGKKPAELKLAPSKAYFYNLADQCNSSKSCIAKTGSYTRQATSIDNNYLKKIQATVHLYFWDGKAYDLGQNSYVIDKKGKTTKPHEKFTLGRTNLCIEIVNDSGSDQNFIHTFTQYTVSPTCKITSPNGYSSIGSLSK